MRAETVFVLFEAPFPAPTAVPGTFQALTKYVLDEWMNGWMNAKRLQMALICVLCLIEFSQQAYEISTILLLALYYREKTESQAMSFAQGHSIT